jgi:hypothetical protein
MGQQRRLQRETEDEPKQRRITVLADPWGSSTGEEEWIVTYDVPEGGEVWETRPASPPER